MAVERFCLESMVRGFHVYKSIWDPVVGEVLVCNQEFGNIHDPYAVSVIRDRQIVGHVPRSISSLCYFFLRRNGNICCQITGRRRRSIDLPQGGLEVPCTLTFLGCTQDVAKVKKLVLLAPTKCIEPPLKKKKVEVIVDDEEDDPHWLKFQGYQLMESDRKALISNDWLNDRHINYAQTILYYQFQNTEGLQNTIFQTKEQVQKIKRGVQIIFDRGNHWIVASTINLCSSDTISHRVQVYDSLYSTLTDETVGVIKNLFEVTGEIEMANMQRQIGTTDCGLFAIAVITALLHGIDPSMVTFKQGEMRKHLISSFTAKSLIPFPIS